MALDPEGNVLHQKRLPILATVKADVKQSNNGATLYLSAPNIEMLVIPPIDCWQQKKSVRLVVEPSYNFGGWQVTEAGKVHS